MRPTYTPVSNSLLKNVSRSFYLTMRVLPRAMREPISLAYLVARAADTIADTRSIRPEHRRQLLDQLRMAIDNPSELLPLELHTSITPLAEPHEKQLLAALPSLLGSLQLLADNDRCAIRKVLLILLSGMQFDFDSFPDENSGEIRALDDRAALDRYTYMVAGCVGEFWTDMMRAHVPAMKIMNVDAMSRLGIRFGQALQMTNVLRDCAQDLRIGRCYFPQTMLDLYSLNASQLLSPENEIKIRPLMHALMTDTLDHFRAAIDYTLAIPTSCYRLRLACLWPIVIGLETLHAHARNPHWLAPEHRSKISRAQIYRILITSLPRASSNTAVQLWTNQLLQQIEMQLHH